MFGVEETIEVLALGLGSIVAAALVGWLGIDGAMIAAGAVLPAAAALTVSRLGSSEAGAHVSERDFGLVRRLPIFAPLPVAALENLTLRLTERRFDAGDRIVTQGDSGDAFFVIADGEVDVDVDGAGAAEAIADDRLEDTRRVPSA